MNAVFDLNRWLLYVGKHWNENKRKYLLSMGALAGLLVLWFSFLMIIRSGFPIGNNMQMVTYYVGLFLTGCLYASLLFSDLSEGPKAISYLLLPVSLLEKLLTAILFGVIFYFICYTVIFYVIDIPIIKLSNEMLRSKAALAHFDNYSTDEVVNVFVDPGNGDFNINFYILLLYFGIQSIFLLGSVYFVKNNYIKTLVWGLIVFLILVFFVHKVLGSFMPYGGFFKPFTVYRVSDVLKGELMIELPEWLSSILLFLIKYSLAPCLWVVAYFRLKEKEV